MVEELLVERDWAVGLIGLDLLDAQLYPLLYEHLDERARLVFRYEVSAGFTYLAGLPALLTWRDRCFLR